MEGEAANVYARTTPLKDNELEAIMMYQGDVLAIQHLQEDVYAALVQLRECTQFGAVLRTNSPSWSWCRLLPLRESLVGNQTLPSPSAAYLHKPVQGGFCGQ